MKTAKMFITRSLFVPILTLLLAGCSADQPEPGTICRPSPDIHLVESSSGSSTVELLLETNAGTWSVAPSYAIWALYPDGSSQSLYATCKAAKNAWHGGGNQSESLPVWYRVRDLEGLDPEGARLDAITTATPTRSTFVLHWEPAFSGANDTIQIFVEANLPNDHNDFYTPNQGSNGQPSVIWKSSFMVLADSLIFIERPRYIGHSHPKGIDSEVYPDRNGITTAMEIFSAIRLRRLNPESKID